MLQPTWFDKAFTASIGGDGTGPLPDAQQVLAEIARNPRIIQAVQSALDSFDAHSKQPGWAGPSRTQAVRQALTVVLQADQ